MGIKQPWRPLQPRTVFMQKSCQWTYIFQWGRSTLVLKTNNCILWRKVIIAVQITAHSSIFHCLLWRSCCSSRIQLFYYKLSMRYSCRLTYTRCTSLQGAVLSFALLLHWFLTISPLWKYHRDYANNHKLKLDWDFKVIPSLFSSSPA